MPAAAPCMAERHRGDARSNARGRGLAGGYPRPARPPRPPSWRRPAQPARCPWRARGACGQGRGAVARVAGRAQRPHCRGDECRRPGARARDAGVATARAARTGPTRPTSGPNSTTSRRALPTPRASSRARKNAVATLLDSDMAIGPELDRLAARIASMAGFDDALAPVAELLGSAAIQVDEAGHALRRYRERLEIDPGGSMNWIGGSAQSPISRASIDSSRRNCRRCSPTPSTVLPKWMR